MTTQTMEKNDARTNTSQKEQATLRDVRHDLQDLKEDVSDVAAGAVETGTLAVQQGTEAMIDSTKRAAETAKDAHGQMCEYVSKHPTTSVLLAFGLGALAARFLSRS